MRSLGRQELSKDEAAGARSLRARGGRGAERALPEPFARWFADRGWRPRPHQLALLDAAEQRRSTLLIAPTGAGKTLAGFLPSLVNLAQRRRDKRENKGAGLHTLYISPLKALAVDVARNVMAPIAEMGLPIRTETRTGDTPVSRRQRQRVRPPDILMTTPEQLALLLSHPDCGHLFADLDTLILDELHALEPDQARRSPGARHRAAAHARAEPHELRSVGNGGAPLGAARLPRAPARQQPVHRDGRCRAHRGRRQAGDLDPRDGRAGAVGRPHHALRLERDLRRDRAQPPEPRIRQHAHAGGAAVPGAVAHQRPRAADRAAPRLARHRAPAQGRGRDGSRHVEGGHRHLDARPRHRLGRRRPRDPRRRAQGRKPLHPAHRPLQPPARGALARTPGAVEPLRGARVPRRARCGGGRRAGCGAVALGRARRARPARARHRVRGRLRAGGAL